MIPHVSIEPSSGVPRDATFWMPDLLELGGLDEGGVGFFRDTWPIFNVSSDEARELLNREAAVLPVLDQLADDVDTFERLAGAIEFGHDFEELTDTEEAALSGLLWEEGYCGLDFGIAGLVYALGSVGTVPAASCRGHFDAGAWSPLPVVYLAADNSRATVLASLIAQVGCRLSADGELLVVEAPSLVHAVDLAGRIDDARLDFEAQNILG